VDKVLTGEASAEERETLEYLSASSPEVRKLIRSRAALFSDLRRIPAVEPPTDLKGGILEAVRREAAQAESSGDLAAPEAAGEAGATGSRVPIHSTPRSTHAANRKWVLGGAVVLAAIVAVIALRNPGPKTNTQGTIGAARPSHPELASGARVSLDSPLLASFIESETFRRLAASPAFREAAKSDAFNRMLANDALREASAKHDLARVFGNAHVTALLASDVFARGMTDARVREALLRSDLAHRIDKAHLAELLKSEVFQDAAQRAEFVKIVDAHLAAALEVDGFRAVMDGLTLDTFAAVREVASSPAADLFRDGAFREAAARAEFSQVAAAGFVEALARVPR